MKQLLITTFAISMLAAIASANDHGGGPGRGDFGPRPGIIVASDGSVYILTPTQVERITSSGAVAWTITIADPRERLVLSGSNLISVTESTSTDGTVSSTLTGISTSSGAAAWTRTLNGRVVELEPFSAGTYAIVVVPATATSGSATRSLVAIGNDGSVLWTVTLT